MTRKKTKVETRTKQSRRCSPCHRTGRTRRRIPLRWLPKRPERWQSPNRWSQSQSGDQSQTGTSGWDWEEISVPGPDVESRETLLQLAKMSNNAYVEPGDPYWYDLGGNWNSVRVPRLACTIQTSILKDSFLSFLPSSLPSTSLLRLRSLLPLHFMRRRSCW